jgi:4-hydroxyphenylpyruvate dioxygenase
MTTPSSRTHTINPLGTDGFEFVEYTAPDLKGIAALKALFVSLGFAEVAKHRHKQCWLYRQGDINFVVNAEPHSQAEEFASPWSERLRHGVSGERPAQQYAIGQGPSRLWARSAPWSSTSPPSTASARVPLFVDRYGERGSIYDVDFIFYPDWQARMAEVDAGLYEIDHLTHNVHRGNMNLWSNFYERIGNFREIRYFDIEGKLTGLHSAP